MSAKRNISRFDIDLVSFLLLILSFCFLPVFFSFRDGSEVIFYAGFPMLFAAISSIVSLDCIDSFVERQVHARIQRHRYRDALTFYGISLRCSLYAGIIKFFVFFVLSGFIGGTVLGYSLIAPILRMFTPALCLISFLGSMKGLLRGIGQERIARISMWVQTAAFVILGIACGLSGSLRGEKVGVLLRNPDIRAAYCACGIALGLDIATAVSFLYLAFMCFLLTGRLRHEWRQEEPLEGTRQEDQSQVMHYYVSSLIPSLIPAVLYILGMMIGYQLWLNGQNGNERVIISRWGGYMGIGYPAVTGSAVLAVLPFTADATRLVREHERGNMKYVRNRLQILLRLSAYVSIPWSAFLFGAAKEIVGLFPNLTFRAQESAILTIKAGCFQVFLLQTGILILIFSWRTMHRRHFIISLFAGFFFQIVLQVILKLAGGGITLDAWSLDLLLAVCLCAMAVLIQTDRNLRIGWNWLMADVRIAICAAAADIPVILLNDYLLLVMHALPAFLIEILLFNLIFVTLSIVLHAVDLRNIGRIPGAAWIRSYSELLTGRSVEDAR